jgi:hypothetical protein
MFFTPKPKPTAPQSLFYQQSQTPQKPFTQKTHPPNSSAKHLCLSHTISRNLGTKLTKPTPASFLPSLQPNANKPQRGKEEEASQSASNHSLSSSSSLCPDPENATNRPKAHRRQQQTKRSFFRRRRRRPSSQSMRDERGLTESERQKTNQKRARDMPGFISLGFHPQQQTNQPTPTQSLNLMLKTQTGRGFDSHQEKITTQLISSATHCAR